MANFFPRWSNSIPLKLVVCVVVLLIALTAGVWYYFTPKYTRVGYMPIQPVAFPHDIHVAQLGMDCRYCHSFVEVSAHSNIPTTQTCMNCHQQVLPQSPKLEQVRVSWQTGEPIRWVQIHKTPDYVFFNHSAHVNRGISCYSCHGQVNRMDVVYHKEPQSMSWCLDCHRAPENHLRPMGEVFNLDWKPDDGESQREIGMKLKHAWHVNPPQTCDGCHR
jgi:Cytochrome c7 and related cytochrome c